MAMIDNGALIEIEERIKRTDELRMYEHLQTVRHWLMGVPVK